MADEQITSSTANIPYINVINQGSDQTAPSAGRAILYIKSGILYVRLDTGSPVAVGGAVALAEGQLAVGDGSGDLSALALGTEGQVVTADASGFATWDDLPAGDGGGYPESASIAALSWTAYSGGAPTIYLWPSQPFYYIMQRSAAAQNDSLTYKVSLAAGTYSLRVIYEKESVNAIATITLGGVAVGTLDMYAAGATWNQVETFTGIVLGTGGAKDLVFTASTRNGSASGWQLPITLITIWRTA